MPASKGKMQAIALYDQNHALHNIVYGLKPFEPSGKLNIRWVPSLLLPVLYLVVRTLLKITTPVSSSLLRANRFLVERVVL